MLRGITEVGNGNEANLKKMPGKKVVMNEGFKALEGALENVINESFSMPKPNYCMAKHSLGQEVIKPQMHV
jgi:hypothetical protein